MTRLRAKEGLFAKPNKSVYLADRCKKKADMLVASVDGINGVNRQPLKKVNFTVNRQKCRVILSKSFNAFHRLTILADLHWHLAPAESLNWKNRFPCCQKHSLQTSIYQEIFQNFIGEWPNQPPETQKLISMNLEVNKSYSKSRAPPT